MFGNQGIFGLCVLAYSAIPKKMAGFAKKHHLSNLLLMAICISFPRASSFGQSPINPLTAATATGTLPNATIEGVRENISLATGDVNIYIPMLSDVGKGGQTYVFAVGYDNHSAYSLQTSTGFGGPQDVSVDWVTPAYPNVPQFMTPTLTASIEPIGTSPQYCTIPPITPPPPNPPNAPVTVYATTNFVFEDETGTSHIFPNQRDISSNTNGIAECSGEAIFEAQNVEDATDASFMRLDTTNANDIIVYKKDGTQYHFSGLPTNYAGQSLYGSISPLWSSRFSRIIDIHGNTITGGTNKDGSFTITDSLGRVFTYDTSGSLHYVDSNGTPQVIKVTVAFGGYAFVPQSVTLGSTNCSPGFNADETAIWQGNSNAPQFAAYSSVAFQSPTGATYTFYLDNLGELARLAYPTGGYTHYTYASFPASYNMGVQVGVGASLTCSASFRELVEKQVCPSTNQSLDQTASCQTHNTIYKPTVSSNLGNTYNDVLDPYDNKTHYAFLVPGPGGHSAGSPLEVERDIYSGATNELRKVTTSYYPVAVPSTVQDNVFDLQLPKTVTTTLMDVLPNVSSQVVYTYDMVVLESRDLSGSSSVNIDNPIEIDEYDYGSSSPTRVTTYQWEKGGVFDVAANHILNAPQSVTVTGGGLTSTTTYTYFPSSPNVKSKAYSGTRLTPLTITYNSYDAYGEPISVSDPKGNTTTYGYTGPWYDSECATGADSKGKVTSETNALGQTIKYSYYSCSGLLASVKDENNQQTTYTYEPGGRVHSTNYPDDGSVTFNYVDNTGDVAATPLGVTKTTAATPNPSLVSTITYDGVGNVVKNQSALTEVDTTYDLLERKSTISNPFTIGSTEGALTRYNYDALNRLIIQQQQDGSILSWCYNGVASDSRQSCSTNKSVSSNDSWVDFVDEVGNHWQRVTDGLGRLVSVVEPVASSNILGLETDYSYDALDNVLSVNQKGGSGDTPRVRTFTYDSLSRLICASNPENSSAACPTSATATIPSGVIAYLYDASGNVSSKTDARGIVIGYRYDALNRLISKGSSGYLTSCYQYDGNEANGTGRLANEWTQTGASCPTAAPSSGAITLRSIQAYDQMGRIKTEQQCMPGGNCKTTSGPQLWSGYDLAGNQTCLVNSVAPTGTLTVGSPPCLSGDFGTPSGLLLTNSYDSAGHLQSVTSNWTAYPTTNIYALGTNGYGPVGPLNWTLGPNITLNQTYDNRLRVNSIIASPTVP